MRDSHRESCGYWQETRDCSITKTFTVTSETVTETVTNVEETIKTVTRTVTKVFTERAVASELLAGDCRLLHQRAAPIKAHGTAQNTQQLHYGDIILSSAVRKKRPMGCWTDASAMRHGWRNDRILARPPLQCMSGIPKEWHTPNTNLHRKGQNDQEDVSHTRCR